MLLKGLCQETIQHSKVESSMIDKKGNAIGVGKNLPGANIMKTISFLSLVRVHLMTFPIS